MREVGQGRNPAALSDVERVLFFFFRKYVTYFGKYMSYFFCEFYLKIIEKKLIKGYHKRDRIYGGYKTQ